MRERRPTSTRSSPQAQAAPCSQAACRRPDPARRPLHSCTGTAGDRRKGAREKKKKKKKLMPRRVGMCKWKPGTARSNGHATTVPNKITSHIYIVSVALRHRGSGLYALRTDSAIVKASLPRLGAWGFRTCSVARGLEALRWLKAKRRLR